MGQGSNSAASECRDARSPSSELGGWAQLPGKDRLKLLAETVDRVSEGILLVARDGTIRFANTVVELTMGYQPGELTGQNAYLLSFRSREAFEGLLQTAFEATENGSAALVDLEGRRQDGSLLPLQGRFSSLTLGATRYVIAVFTDISARKQLEREMIQLATQVQQRVSGDLHEGLGQQLSGIAMMLQGLRSRLADAGPAAALVGGEIDQLVTLLNGAVRRTRLLARGLSPVRPSVAGLTEGFEELVNTVHEVYGQRVRLAMDLPAELTADENSVMNLFHIAQEAVENAARHAAASDIEVTFRVVGADLELQVVDDGVGFDPAQVAPVGMGLRMMRFRAELARGYLLIESRPGHGARLRCRCPARTYHTT
jgi:PAS domain S-box-containing protein